jgi:hypothetical protein
VSSAAPEFGPNDWFVEEKYQQFLADPKSVDPIWRDFFADAKAPSALLGVKTNGGKAATGAPDKEPTAVGAAPASEPVAAAPSPSPASPPPPARNSAPPPPPPPHRPQRAATPSPAARTTPRAGGKENVDVAPTAPARRPTTTATPDDMVAAKAAKAAKAAHEAEGDGLTTTPLRGAAAMVV